MAIVREGFTLFETTTAGPGPATNYVNSHVVQSGTIITIFSVHMRGSVDITTTPFFNTSETFTLIHESTNSGQDGDSHTYVYGLINPTATTADIEYDVDSTDKLSHTAVNYSGTISSNVAAATNFLSEDVNDTSTTTSVHASAGTSGSTLFFAGSHVLLTADPSSNDAGFFEISDGDAFDTGSGIAYYVCDKIGGGASAITVTWNDNFANASVYIEVLPAVSGLSIPVARNHYKQQHRIH